MDHILITGARPLKGQVTTAGAKNSALPILASTLLGGGECVITNLPHVRDVATMQMLLNLLGASVKVESSQVIIDTESVQSLEAPYDLVKTMRASVLVLGPTPSTVWGSHCVSSRRMCHWTETGEFAPPGFNETRRTDYTGTRVHSRACHAVAGRSN